MIMDDTSSNVVSSLASSLGTSNSFMSYNDQPIKTVSLNSGDEKSSFNKYYNVSASSLGDRIAISSEKNLYVISTSELLESTNNSNNTLKKISKNISSNISSWNPTPQSNILLLSNNDSLSLWDIDVEKPLSQISKAHGRHVTSLDWNRQDTNIFVSASSDCFIKIWDQRELGKNGGSTQNSIPCNKPPSNLSQVRWNPFNSTMLASSHNENSEIRIYDTRKFGSPLIAFTAHIGQITSVDWSPYDRNKLLTSSSDRFVKVWDLSPPIKMIQQYQTPSPCTLSRFLPSSLFTPSVDGPPDTDAIVSISQHKSYNDISFWSKSHQTQPTLQLFGHLNSIIDFDILNFNQNNYITSIGKDDQLNLWNLTNDMVQLLQKEEDPNKDFNKQVLVQNVNIPNNNNNNNNNNNSSSNKTTTRSQPIMDLQQELNRMNNEKFKMITIEKSSYNDRICLVSIDSRKLMIIILFPFLYPLSPPSYDVIIPTPTTLTNSDDSALTQSPILMSTTDTNIKVKLKKKLDKLTFNLIDSKKPFVIPLLHSLSQFYAQNTDFFNALEGRHVTDNQIQKHLPKSIKNIKRLSINNNILNDSSGSDASSLSSISSGSSIFSPPSTSTPTPVIISPNISSENGNGGGSGRNRSYSASTVLPSQDFGRGRSTSFNAHNSFIAPPPPPANLFYGSQSVLFEMYVVKPTDTLTGISIQFNMPRDILVQANRLLSDKQLIPGAILWVYKKKDYLQPVVPSVTVVPISETKEQPEGPTNGTNPTVITTPDCKAINQMKAQSFLQARINSKPSHSPTVNINNLFKPLKEEVEMAFSIGGNSMVNIGNQRTNQITQQQQQQDSNNNSGWGNSYRNFTTIPKEHIVKEKLVCFMKDKKVFGNLTLTPYQLIFQSIDSLNPKPIQFFTDYSQIMSCKYFPNKSEWLHHLTKDWNKEQYLIKKMNNSGSNVNSSGSSSGNSKSPKQDQQDDQHEKFIQSEISKLNEMEDEQTMWKQTDILTGETIDSKVLVFPCIYVLVHKDRLIQTLFFRGIDVNSVHSCFSYIKKQLVDRKLSSSQNSSPIMSSSNNSSLNSSSTSTAVGESLSNSSSLQTTPVSKPIQIPESISLNTLGISGISKLFLNQETPDSFEDLNSHTPQLLHDQEIYKQKEQILMNMEFFKKLRHYLPIRTQNSDIQLLFNTTCDGISFSTFYRKLKNFDQSLLLIKDQNGHIFGAYLSEEIHITKAGELFYGTGETFLFSFHPHFQVYKWTRENELFISTTFDSISIGGGSMFGIWMDSDFTNGYTGPCETFGNPCLSYSNDFKPMVVECWGIKN